MSEAFDAVVTALADDELVIGHRHSEWTGYAPHLEEDVAFASIAQDEIGHASSYYALVEDGPARVDALALGRQLEDYRNAVLCERPNRDWAFTLARHWLYDHADDIRLAALEDSTDPRLRQLVTKIRREERYHLLHADYWMKRVAHGPVDGRSKVELALGEAIPEAGGLFEPFEREQEALGEGWLPVASPLLRARFEGWLTGALDELGLPGASQQVASSSPEFVASSSGDLIADDGAQPEGNVSPPQEGGRRGRHTEDLAELWRVMTTQYRENEGATW